jgi:D-alanyl-D-alanine endopeptidase (penicillin-binding protein 7)
MYKSRRDTWASSRFAGGAASAALFACALLFQQPSMAAGATKAAEVATSKADAVKVKSKRRSARSVPSRPSAAQLQGLRGTEDPLDLRSSVALVVDQDTDEVLVSKNSEAVLPIASITKLMTAMVVVDAAQPMDETLRVERVALDTPRNNRSRLKVGAELTRGELMHLALMSSENRAAFSLGANYPGGMDALVEAMNQKAHALGMHDSHFVEPTGLSSKNQSSAHDLALLVKAAYQHPQLREYSTTPDASVAVGRRQVQFRNTNALVRSPSWEIGLQKTGFISEAGRCVVMQAQLAGRKLIMVLLDSTGRYTRIGDAERIRRWLSQRTASDSSAVPAPQLLTSTLSASVSEGGGNLSGRGADSF